MWLRGRLVPVWTLLLTDMASALWITVAGSYSCPSARHTAAHTAPDPHARHTTVQAEDTASRGSSEDGSLFMVSLHKKVRPTSLEGWLSTGERPVPGILRQEPRAAQGTGTARQEQPWGKNVRQKRTEPCTAWVRHTREPTRGSRSPDSRWRMGKRR